MKIIAKHINPDGKMPPGLRNFLNPAADAGYCRLYIRNR